MWKEIEAHFFYCPCGRLTIKHVHQGKTYSVSCTCGSNKIREINEADYLKLEDMPFNSSRVEWYNNQRQKEWWEV